ncbi:MAG: two-component system, response regulator PdtaR [Alphaproteobacteria bacterium]|nr:two-component system, response regulator PdtaR [Alphaproteobacteria bacterium]
MRVLIAEDDALIGLLLEEILRGMGHEVCAIEATEAGAVTAAIEHRPDLMIVDARLGKGSGVSAVDEILRRKAIAHLFVSGDPRAIQARHPDAVVVRKPFRETELVRAIEIALVAAAATA